MRLQSHPWLKGFEHFGANIASHPIIFQVTRLLRRKAVPTVQKFVSMEIDGATETSFVLPFPVDEGQKLT
jgi:hypothetical protein